MLPPAWPASARASAATASAASDSDGPEVMMIRRLRFFQRQRRGDLRER